MKHSAFLTAVILVTVMSVAAQTVDRDEFADILNRTVDFVNYQGEYQRIDTLEQILGIGNGLGSTVRRSVDSQGSYGDKYRVLHIVGDPQEPGKPADILFLLPAAGVDHIDNIRRIISSYLSRVYGYSKQDADLLSVFITIYNAVHRGNLKLFEQRYKASVVKELTADKVGLGVQYTEWPGKSQIVIPLSIAGVLPGNNLAAVASADLITPEVIATVRDQPGQGVDQRQQLADLMDRAVDQERDTIQQQQAVLDNQRDNQSQTTATSAQDQNTSTNQQQTNQADADNAQNQAATTDDASNRSTQQNTTTTQAVLDERRDQADELADASAALREDTVADLADESQPAVTTSSPVVVVQVSFTNGLILSRLQKINSATSEIVAQSATSDIIGRKLVDLGQDYVVIERDGENARLVLLNKDTFAENRRGTAVISTFSDLAVLPSGTGLLAVLEQDGEWYLGRFDPQLNPTARSGIPVDPVGAIQVFGDTVFIQRKDGRITALKLVDLTSVR